jgi:hypothetical protein
MSTMHSTPYTPRPMCYTHPKPRVFVFGPENTCANSCHDSELVDLWLRLGCVVHAGWCKALDTHMFMFAGQIGMRGACGLVALRLCGMMWVWLHHGSESKGLEFRV